MAGRQRLILAEAANVRAANVRKWGMKFLHIMAANVWTHQKIFRQRKSLWESEQITDFHSNLTPLALCRRRTFVIIIPSFICTFEQLKSLFFLL
uniref:Uncharacterized protein n=1 Tax=Globodera rostochiensis TaxID=31243 RepID=A0A914HIM0_GLORO